MRTTESVNLQTAHYRKKLPKKGLNDREPHWHVIDRDKQAALGWERKGGRWILRFYKGERRYARVFLGLADDGDRKADGKLVYDYEQAVAAAEKHIDGPAVAAGKYSVTDAMSDYIAFKAARGQPTNDLVRRSRVWITPKLGSYAVRELTAERLNDWFSFIGSAPAMKRTKKGHPPQFKPAPVTRDQIRARQASANRVLNYLKGALNRAFANGKVASDAAWRGKRLQPYPGVDTARKRFLTKDQAAALIDACDSRFKPLVSAALFTGCRLSELTRLQAQDFNSKAGTIYIHQSKSGKPRHVVLTDEGIAFFRERCTGNGLLFPDWKPSTQGRPMKGACKRAGIDPPISFHILRHTWASLAAEADMSIQIIGGNLGHAPGSPITAKHYAHLSESHNAKEIRAKAPF